ncbi:MAG: helix-turn-helix domain-containing protein [Oligoflexia bacterium]|nr:helix-turn-helix domain-containing protein [Oligoflexia bacterium]MBF0366653.1 helix-turn-helix domain-containing protein [Oligoflexia bacterium]
MSNNTDAINSTGNQNSANDASDTGNKIPESMTIGALFKSTREKRGTSLEEISRKTKILFTLLRELEKDNLEELPGKTYVRGFVKSYAREIGIDQQLALDILDQTYKIKRLKIEEEEQQVSHRVMKKEAQSDFLYHPDEDGQTNPGHKMAPSMQKRKQRLKEESTTHNYRTEIGNRPLMQRPWFRTALKVVTGLIIFTALIGVPVFYIYNAVQQDSNANAVREKKQVDQQKAIEVVTAPEKAVAVITAPTLPTPETLMTPIAAVAAPATTQKTAVVAPIAPAVPSRPTAIPTTPPRDPASLSAETTTTSDDKIRYRKMPVPTYNVKEKLQPKTPPPIRGMQMPRGEQEKSEENLPDHIKNAYTPTLQNIYIKAADGDSWVTYKKDSMPVQSFPLRKGRALFLQGKDVRILMGNVSATKVFYNNNLLDLVPSSDKGIRHLVFPAEHAPKYHIPLFVTLKSGEIITSEEYKRNNPESVVEEN